MNIYDSKVRKALEIVGSKAQTARGQARALTSPAGRAAFGRAKLDSRPVQWLGLDRIPVGSEVKLDAKCRRLEGYTFRPRRCSAATDRAAEEIGKCGQRSNYAHGEPRICGQPHQARWETVRYKGRYSGYTGSMLYWDYQSCVGMSRSGRSAVVILECKLVRRIVAPAGLVFTHDANGILLRRVSDGMDYHPEDADWTAKDFATRVRKAMAANWAKRREAKRAAKQAALDAAEAARVAAIRECELATTRVTLDDSRRAGNCVEGSLAFAERKLHFSPRNDFSTNIFAGRGPSSRVERHYSPFAAAPGVSFTEAAWLG